MRQLSSYLRGPTARALLEEEGMTPTCLPTRKLCQALEDRLGIFLRTVCFKRIKCVEYMQWQGLLWNIVGIFLS